VQFRVVYPVSVRVRRYLLDPSRCDR